MASACLAVGSCEPTPRTSPVSSPQSERPQPCGALILKLPGSSTFEDPPLPTGSWVYAEVAPLCHLSLKGSACYNEPGRNGLGPEHRAKGGGTCRAHPLATASSAFSVVLTSFPKNLAIFSFTAGIRVAPPTISTALTSSALS